MTSTVTATRRPVTWPERAACRGADPDLFGPHHLSRPTELATAVAAAQLYCARCPVRHECATEADDDQLQGVWGGIHRIRDHSGRGDLVRTPLLTTSLSRKASR